MMKIIFKFIFIFLILFSSLGHKAFALDPDIEAEKKRLNSRIEELVRRSKIPTDRLGLVIGFSGLKSDSIYNLNGQKKMIPASLTKIITASAALERLPIGYQMTTTLQTEAEILNGELQGDLYLKGGGDSGFVSESLWFLVNHFMRSGVKVIKGDIVVDDTVFDNIRYDPGRDPGRTDEPYDAPIGGMTLNWSSVAVHARPAAKLGEPAQIFVDPDGGYLKVVNKTRTVKGNRHSLRFSRHISTDKNFIEEIFATGDIGIESREVTDYRSITRPDLWAGYGLKEFLQQRGVRIEGEIKIGKTPSSARVLASFKSKPVADVVRDMMKFSNNTTAESLAKLIAVQDGAAQGTMDRGLEVIRAFLRSQGIIDFNITSPSGLSRRNQFKADDIFQVLSHVKKNFKIYPEFLASFPIMGVDGTLKKKPEDSPIFARVRAKTGYLSGVVSLAGYLGRASEDQITFVFMYNGEFNESAKARDLFDQILTIL